MLVKKPASIFTLMFIVGLSVNLATGLQCYKCDSTKTPDCAINPTDQLESKECAEKDTECVMAILEDLATYRGCASDIKIPEDCRSCLNATCTGDLCNGGIYPEDRLKCYKCERQECVNISGTPKPCLNYDKSDLCYVDVIDEIDVIRGCVSDYDFDAGVYTTFCRTDGCNDPPAVSQFTCLSCDSNKDANCKHGDTSNLICKVNVTNICSVDVLFGRSESCFTYHDGERAVRGCSRLEPELIMQSQLISVCRSSDCNDDCIINPTCHICDSNDNDDCFNDQSALTPQDCPVETASCFTCKHDDDSLTRGCGGNSTLFDQKRCLSCWNKNGCNTGTIQTCFHCNSATDKNCALWSNGSAVDTAVCTEKCVAKVTVDNFTVRGCQTGSLRCSAWDSLCKECEGDNCNGGIFPENRQTCYQCDETDPACDSDKSSIFPAACYNYKAFDGCFHYYNSNGHSIRGCVSDLRYYGCIEHGNSACEVCNGNGCNSKGLKVTENLQCNFCNSYYDETCGWAQKKTRDCLPRVPNSPFAACFKYQFPNKTIIRGCLSDDNACDSALVTCELCAKNGCNGENVIYQDCIQCEGKLGNGACGKDAKGIAATKCSGERQFYENRGCYTKSQGDLVTRGCLNEMNYEALTDCQRDADCRTCFSQGYDSVTRGCSNGTALEGICESCSSTSGCNSKEVQACYQCDSEVNENCATWNHFETVGIELCPGSCITKVLHDGRTLRDCKSDNFTCDSNSLFCEECSDLACNAGAFPKSRLHCFQCDEQDDLCSYRPYGIPYACPVYDTNDLCYQFLSGDNKMVRGCKSDKRYGDCKENGDHCYVCSGPECNNFPAEKANSLHCMVCDDNEACPWAQLASKTCSSFIPFYAEPACFTHTYANTSVARGCMGDPNECNPSAGKNCEICTSSGCNKLNKIYQSCIQCKGQAEDSNNCYDSAQNLETMPCPNNIQFYELRGCYVMREGETVTRGCLNELDEATLKMCRKGDEECKTCLPQGCNYQKAPSSAFKLTSSFYLLCIFLAAHAGFSL